MNSLMGENSVLRREDYRLVTGSGHYTADLFTDGCLHSVVLRSDRARAVIRSIDLEVAKRMSGVRLIVTGPDLMAVGIRPQTAIHAKPGTNGARLLSTRWYPLAVTDVRYVGEPIAMIVADSIEQAQDASDSIVIDYDELEPVIGAERALAQGAPLVDESIPSNLAFDYRCGDEESVERAIAAAKHVVNLTIDSRRLIGNPMEPRSATVSFEEATGCYDVHIPVQTPGTVRFMLADAYGLDPEKVRIHVQDVGGGFGVRTLPYPEYRTLMYAARTLGQPVRWTASRSESFFADSHGRAMKINGTLALDDDYRFVAMRFDSVCDMGAYILPVAPHIMTLTPERGMAGAYKTPAISARFRLAVTNAAPVSAYRGAGRPDMAYAIERLVDATAFELGIDRIELRRRNMIDSFPYTTPLGYTYDSGDLKGAMDRALAEADWLGFEDRRAEALQRGKLRGIGISTFVEVAGNSLGENDSVRITFSSKGQVCLHCETQSTGQSHDLVFRKIVSEALCIPVEIIEFKTVDASKHAFGAGSYASRSTQVVGHLLTRAALNVLQSAKTLLAREWSIPIADIAYSEGEFRCTGHCERLIDLATRLGCQSPHPLDVSMTGLPPVSFPNGSHVAEVEIDPDTGKLSICNYVAVDDVGTVQNHAVVIGQVMGGVVQSAGQVFGEECIYDDTGQLLNGSFADYFMPHAGLVPRIKVLDHPSTCTTNAIGAKGVGEAGTTGGLSSMMNAIADALRVTGIRHIDPPVTPAKLWQALQNAKAYGGKKVTEEV